MRQLALFVLYLNAKFSENQKLIDYLKPKFFNDLMITAKTISNIDDEQKKGKSFGTKVGYSIKRYQNILESKGITSEISEVSENSRKMLSLYKWNWYENKSYKAFKILRTKNSRMKMLFLWPKTC